MRAFALLSMIATLTGCNVQLGKQTKGDLGRVSFQYDGWGCGWGCDLYKPLMRGGVQPLTATMPSLSMRTASLSTNPSKLAQVSDKGSSLGDNGVVYRAFDISAADAGDVQFSMMGSDGQPIDHVTVHIREAARLNAQWAKSTPGHSPEDDAWSSGATAALSGDTDVRINAYDASGQQLQFSRGVTVTVSDQRVVSVRQEQSGDSWFFLHPLASGTAILTAKIGTGVSTQLTVTVK
jgi:hypothetical protein